MKFISNIKTLYRGLDLSYDFQKKKGNEYLFELLIIHIYQNENHMLNCCIESADAIHLPYRYEIHKKFT